MIPNRKMGVKATYYLFPALILLPRRRLARLAASYFFRVLGFITEYPNLPISLLLTGK